ncbi:MAG: hypothetical protein F6K11_30090, partial [Leptolyngbya sp. SIO3F4]|nr:hypothetical protein [Leptolyngbya sp. SIO3F4]
MSHSLKAEIEILKQQVQRLIQNQQALGLPTSPWVSPQQAANLLCTSRGRINNEIDKAEYARINKIKYDLTWGTHYRKNGAHWQINPLEFEKIIFQPPENRPYVEIP